MNEKGINFSAGMIKSVISAIISVAIAMYIYTNHVIEMFDLSAFDEESIALINAFFLLFYFVLGYILLNSIIKFVYNFLCFQEMKERDDLTYTGPDFLKYQEKKTEQASLPKDNESAGNFEIHFDENGQRIRQRIEDSNQNISTNDYSYEYNTFGQPKDQAVIKVNSQILNSSFGRERSVREKAIDIMALVVSFFESLLFFIIGCGLMFSGIYAMQDSMQEGGIAGIIVILMGLIAAWFGIMPFVKNLNAYREYYNKIKNPERIEKLSNLSNKIPIFLFGAVFLAAGIVMLCIGAPEDMEKYAEIIMRFVGTLIGMVGAFIIYSGIKKK